MCLGKEARKKELKKNKKQRQMVRQAVLKGKDPAQLLDEMDKIDEMEYNVFQPSPLNEKVLKEKRKKLKETFDRVMKLYHQEDPELFADLKRKEIEYEKKRNKRITYYESVRQAESIRVDEIPLPSAKEMPTPSALPRIQLPPPSLIIPPIPQAMLNKMQQPPPMEEKPEPVEDIELLSLPCVPPMPPPNLEEFEDLDSDYDESQLPKNQKKKKKVEDVELRQPSEVQQKMLAMSGQNIDDFMKEMENVQRKRDTDKTTEDSKSESEESETESPSTAPAPTVPAPNAADLQVPRPPQMPMIPPLRPMIPPPFPVGFPPSAPPMHLRGIIPGLAPGMRLTRPRMGIRPPGPPPGMPPKFAKGPQVAAGPQISKDPKSATISAKPQIRNLSADVTRFVPTTLRVKKDEIKKPKPKPTIVTQPTQPAQGPTKDDAYMQFMKEMEGFL